MPRQSLSSGEAAPVQRHPGAAVRCHSYAAGHQMHYVHQAQALRSPSEQAALVSLEGSRLIVVRQGGEHLDWVHHDLARLADVLGLFPTSRMVYPGHHALRVGPYWFNCAENDFGPCDIPSSSSARRDE